MALEAMGKRFFVQSAVVNNKGLVRRNNEDNFYFNGTFLGREEWENGAFLTLDCQDFVQLYAVCDGMGGSDQGEEAAFIAVRELAFRKFLHGWLEKPQRMISLLRKISRKICKEAVQKRQRSGTTMVLFLIKGTQAMLVNVGDSRIYRFRERKLEQMSVDDSRVQKLVSMGVLSLEEAKKSPDRHIITQYLGMPEGKYLFPHISEKVELCDGDVYLLCSDGLTEMVEDQQIRKILTERKNPQNAAKELLTEALKGGGRDNITIMLLNIKDIF